MQEISTPELLVKHLYNETNADEASVVSNAFKNQPAIQQEFANLQTAKDALDGTDGHEPSKSVIDTILAFSKNTTAELV